MVEFGGPGDVGSVRARLSSADALDAMTCGRSDPVGRLVAAANGGLAGPGMLRQAQDAKELV